MFSQTWNEVILAKIDQLLQSRKGLIGVGYGALQRSRYLQLYQLADLFKKKVGKVIKYMNKLNISVIPNVGQYNKLHISFEVFSRCLKAN